MFKIEDNMVDGDKLKSYFKLPDVEFDLVFEKLKPGIQVTPEDVKISKVGGISENSKEVKVSVSSKTSENYMLDFIASIFKVGETSGTKSNLGSEQSSI